MATTSCWGAEPLASRFFNINCLLMPSNVNTYCENIDYDFWQKLCVEQRILRSYDKGDFFIERGQVGRYTI